MPKKAMSVREAEQIARSIAQEQGVELVDVELVKEPGGRFLRFYIEKTDEGISLNELEVFHRQILPLVEDMDYDYMEVSSPGANRPLKTDRDFERAEGLMVELRGGSAGRLAPGSVRENIIQEETQNGKRRH